jgi:molecular chaperone GrpE
MEELDQSLDNTIPEISSDDKPVDLLEETQAELDKVKDQYLRAKAETENIRRRSLEEVTKAHKFAIENFAEHLVPVADSLYAALAVETDDAKSLKDGLEITLKQLISAFEKGRMLEVNPAVGDEFDPKTHQAVSMIESDQLENTIVAVLQRGYLIADRILRPAMVTVSKNTQGENDGVA